MAYTIVGLFPTTEDAAKASDKLDNNGFAKEDYKVSNYKRNEEITNDRDYDYDEDEKTTGFWSWLFGDNDADRKRYSYAGTKSNVVTVYTEDEDRAEKARDIMNDMGALNVNDYTKDYYAGSEFEGAQPNSLSANERARIVNKARNNDYSIENERSYNFRRRTGINDTMDSTGDL